MIEVAPRNTRIKEGGWSVFRASLRPKHDVVSHLVFTLKYECIQLLTLRFFFAVTNASDLERVARLTPTSAYIRRIYFFYEWMTRRPLRIPDVTAGTYVDAIDTE